MSDSTSSSDEDEDMGEQVRIALTLSTECPNRELQVASEPIAVPADIGRKGLSAVINHLLDRRLTTRSDHDDSDDDDEDENDERLPALDFDFMLGGNKNTNNKLLRTALEREARRTGLSLEEAIPITYFPAQRAPELTGESDPQPDWISTLQFDESNNLLVAGCYDGSVRLFSTRQGKQPALQYLTSSNNTLSKDTQQQQQRQGPIQCMTTMKASRPRQHDDDDDDDKAVYIACGSMDHSLVVYRTTPDNNNDSQLTLNTTCVDGHVSAVGSVDFFPASHTLASGDWDGGVCVWKVLDGPSNQEEEEAERQQQPNKKVKMDSSTLTSKNNKVQQSRTTSPLISLQAHSSKVSGVSWGNHEKKTLQQEQDYLITGSWDHSLKVWNIPQQDCLLTLNGSRVISCLDTSYSSAGVVATGHPDCTIRLWDVRTAADKKESSILSVSDNTFRPSHKAWISAVQWSRHNPYHLASTSHDGVVKLWDIRSSLPLHSIRAVAKTEKALTLAYGNDNDGGLMLYAGGTDCVVKQFCCSTGGSSL